MAALEEFNAAPAGPLRSRLLQLTAAAGWADDLLAGRPYPDVAALLGRSDALVLALPEAEVDAALAAHPRIGERAAGPDAAAAARSAGEQAGMASADDALRQAMARGNAEYEKRFGRIYLVAAAGRSARELLARLEQRLGHDDATELDVVRGELARITRLRLGDAVGASRDSR